MNTTLSKGIGGISGLTYTSEYPLPYTRVVYTYNSSGNIIKIEFYDGNILQFVHTFVYDSNGNVISKTIT